MSDPTNATEALLKAQQAVEHRSAMRTWGILGCVFALMPADWLDPAVEAIHWRDRESLINHFSKDWGFRSLVKAFGRILDAIDQTAGPPDPRDPRIFMNLCLLLAPLQDEYVPGLDERHRGSVSLHLKNAVDRLTSELPVIFAGQVAALSACIGRILKDLPSRQPKAEGRLILLELPVGNSIPVKVLRRVLQAAGYTVEVWRVSLNRNDSKTHGITRTELLDRLFAQEGLRDGDVIIYLDEWLSGSNFNNLLKVLRKAVARHPGVKVLPAGLLAADAAAQPHYASYCDAHDEMLKGIGLDGNDYRITVPDFASRFRGVARFFWSETDRLAGYRKMQFLGSLLSSLYQAVEQLRADPAARRQAKLTWMHAAATDVDDPFSVSWEAVTDDEVFNDLFEEAYQDYLICKPLLNAIELPSNVAAIDDPWEAWDHVTLAVSEVVNNRKARMCIGLAMFHIAVTGRIDPADPHYFRGHAPVVAELDGAVRDFHEEVVRSLTEVILNNQRVL